MKRFVLDASVALRWFLSRPVPAYAQRVSRMMLGGAHAVVPALWHLEMANALAVAGRRGILDAEDAERACVDIEKLLAQSIETDSSLVPVRQALETANAFKLSAYDAAYLGLARREDLPLATMDEQLRSAARAAKVEIVR